MSEIKQIKDRLNTIEKKIAKHEYNIKSLKEELEDITQQIYKAVDEANKTGREELDNLIMLKNIIKAKIKRQQRL